jgi:hypothetical protein
MAGETTDVDAATLPGINQAEAQDHGFLATS